MKSFGRILLPTFHLATKKMSSDIGLIGLAVMGENLVLNMESKGFKVSVFNRTVQRVTDFVEGRGKGLNV